MESNLLFLNLLSIENMHSTCSISFGTMNKQQIISGNPFTFEKEASSRLQKMFAEQNLIDFIEP